MRARATSSKRRSLADGWRIASCTPGHIERPDDLDDPTLQWLEVPRASTVAACLGDIGAWNLDSGTMRFDAHDWWFRKSFARADLGTDVILGFDGLATVCEVWLNGEPLLTSQSMFVGHEVPAVIREDNDLVIRFFALDQLLRQRRPRPRWRAPMIENQQLRWFRTTVLGRTPGWSPPAAPVGIWRDIWIEQRNAGVDVLDLSATVEGDDGVVMLSLKLTADSSTIVRSEVVVERDNEATSAALVRAQEPDQWSGACRIARPALWWPHTHGQPALYRVRARALTSDGKWIEADLGNVGFRTVEIDQTDGAFDVRINGTVIFCRGACWTPLDTSRLHATASDYASVFELIKDAGMNMLRISGTMVYESDEFLSACDAHGVLLWQDFMFANMDYPAGDAEFDSLVATEVTQQLRRLKSHPCLTVLCGNSEVEQQASMWGAPRDVWSPALFHSTLRELSHSLCPDVPYWPSSAHGGSFPHQPAVGTSSYYGVGAYLRPLDDSRRSQVRFASECLAFANLPADPAIAAMPGGLSLRSHHSIWKARTPRDLGAGWDFEDVRDHYLEQLFSVDARSLRYADHDRYIELSRVVTGEVMAAAFAEWRSRRSSCKGALVWFLKDLWMGAGWGILDAHGAAKPAYYYLRRALQPIGLSLTDEGCNGVTAHIQNDSRTELRATLQIGLYKNGEIAVASTSVPILLGPSSAGEVPLGDHLESFSDLSYAYRFGPPSHDLVVAMLFSPSSERLAQSILLPLGRGRAREATLGLAVTARVADNLVNVTLSCTRFAQAVVIHMDGWRGDDNYFDLAPGQERTIRLERIPGTANASRGTVSALNACFPISFSLPPLNG